MILISDNKDRIIIMQEEMETYKIVIVGNSGTGKTNISTRFTRNVFNELSQATLGVEFMTKIIELSNKKKIKISLWDTAGQERYKALSKVYYKGASGAIIVYDITDPNSYIDLDSWMKLLSSYVIIQDVALTVVGNKVDLQSERKVPTERPYQQFKEAFDIECWEVSAKTGENVQAMFQDLINKIIQKANDVKSTCYRGTIEYAESQRGTLVGGSKIIQPVANNNPLPNGQIIIEVQEDEKSVAEQSGRPNHNNDIRISLSPEGHNKLMMDNQQKKKKCCLKS